MRGNNEVVICKAESGETDPVIASFLNFLAKDMKRNPTRLKAMDSQLRNRLDDLVGHVDIDLDEELSPEDD